jgi:hypothetical protein
MLLPGWVSEPIRAFVAAFARGDATAWIGAASREGFLPVDRSRPGSRLMRDLGAGGRLAPLPGLALEDGFVWLPAPGAGPPELWLSPGFGGYRDAYERFARRYLGAPGLAGVGVHIDHLFPRKAAALDGLAYVRMLAVAPSGNMDAGRTVERAMAARARATASRKPVRHATYVSIGKATGFAAWQTLPDSVDAAANLPAVHALFDHLRGFGLDPAVLTALDRRLTADRLRTLR